MKTNRLERLLQNIHRTQDEEISCTECFDLVSSYVELELSGKDAAVKLAPVKQHLGQCPACRAEYETLRDLRRSEEEGGALSLNDLKDLIH